MSRVTISVLILSLCCILVRAQNQDAQYPCPKPEDIQPCLCRRFCDDCKPIIECSGLKTNEDILEIVTRSGDYPFAAFTVSNAEIDYVPISALESKQIQVLTVVNSSLVSLFDGIPPESRVLRALYLHNLKLQRGLRWEPLYQLHALRTLTVSRIDVPQIGDNFGLVMPKQIRVVHISRTKTAELGKNVFAPLKNLNSIVVRHNQIRNIERTMFPKPYRGTVLDFSYNRIQQLSDDFFTDMPHLKALVLNNNNVATLSEKVFAHVGKSVNYVPLRDNPIKCDCKMKWLTETTREPIFDAQCFLPDNLQGLPLRELTGEDFIHC